jgi:signal transduction histidine kinase
MSKMVIEKHMGGRIYAHNSSSGAELTIELPLEFESIHDAL